MRRSMFVLAFAALLSAGVFGAQASSGESQRSKAANPNPEGEAASKATTRKAKAQRAKDAERKVEVDESVIRLYEPGDFRGMPYRLLKPIDFDPATSYPLILSLHGRAGMGSDNLGNLRVWTGYLASEEMRRRHPCFVLAPQTAISWFAADEKVPDLTEESIQAYPEAWRQFALQRAPLAELLIAPRLAAGGDLTKAFDLLAEMEKEFPIDRDRVYVLGHSMGGPRLVERDL
ncbi:MAG: hypothetical protein NTW86_19190 [Candidatus Sumerlaeota bacterium]|nr:hypothetical protein [Candidatus Sumerlaeota bacterium]